MHLFSSIGLIDLNFQGKRFAVLLGIGRKADPSGLKKKKIAYFLESVFLIHADLACRNRDFVESHGVYVESKQCDGDVGGVEREVGTSGALQNSPINCQSSHGPGFSPVWSSWSSYIELLCKGHTLSLTATKTWVGLRWLFLGFWDIILYLATSPFTQQLVARRECLPVGELVTVIPEYSAQC